MAHKMHIQNLNPEMWCFMQNKIMRKGFSLLEVMMALVVVSIMLAVMAPTLTVKKPVEDTSVQIIDNTPIGAIIAWYGTNYPNDWLPVSGQSITEPEYAILREVLGGLDTLPDLNAGKDPSNSTIWIIKAKRK